MDYLLLPFSFLKFWFWQAPSSIINFFKSLNLAFLQLFSLQLLIKTFFKPWKNEYREGLVNFSIGMGMFIKTFVILVDLLLFCVLLFVESILILGFIGFPFAVIWLLFI